MSHASRVCPRTFSAMTRVTPAYVCMRERSQWEGTWYWQRVSH